MRKPGLLALLIQFVNSVVLFGQYSNNTLKIEVVNTSSITYSLTLSKSAERFPYDKNGSKNYGLNAIPYIGQNGDITTSNA